MVSEISENGGGLAAKPAATILACGDFGVPRRLKVGQVGRFNVSFCEGEVVVGCGCACIDD